MSEKPLVSCVMPTANRREMTDRALALFDAQDYPNKELGILGDSWQDFASELVACGKRDDARGHIEPIDRGTLGHKRNLINYLTRGSLICHWDDDDWYRSDRISLQVEALGDADICGLSRHLFYKPETDETWLYTYPESQRPWLAGGTCLYRRELWERYPFPDVQVGSDTQWMWSWPASALSSQWCDVPLKGRSYWHRGQRVLEGYPVNDMIRMVPIQDYGWYVATIHEGNTSKKVIQEAEWKPWSGDIRALMNDKARVQIV